MSKIFRLHKGLTQNIEHWQKLPNYIDHNTIDSIEDPSGLSASTQITSIPTPFARIDLVKSAFLFVTKSGNLDGNTIYHKIVSDTLDVAELFFNIDAFRDKVEILEWNSGIHMNGGEVSVSNESDLGVLLNSNNPKHKLLGDTLKMFLIQDGEHFNFSKLNHLYFLNYKNGLDRLNIIGGTSPNSIFFPSSNNLSFVDIGIKGYKLFDFKFNPLISRDPDFIKWLFILQQQFPNFSTLFKGFNDYLNITLSLLPEELTKQVKAYNSSNASDYYNSNYNSITINDAGNDIELLSNILKGKKYKDVEVSVEDNDFIINAKKSVIGNIPAVFPLDAFNGNLSFAGTLWQKDWYKNVPKFDPKPIEERTLPNQVHIKYPYLTADDLFEPYILRVPYEIDSTKFFNGNYRRKSNSKVHDFILPLKSKILEYFSAEDLTLNLSDGSKMFELIEIPNGVKAILRVPVKKNTHIQFQREYFNNTSIDSIPPYDENSNQGFIIDSLFTLAIYPFIKLPIDLNPHYRVLLVDKDILPLSKTHNFSLSFHSNSIDKSIQIKPKIKRSDKTQSPKVSTDYYVIESDFDFIQLSHSIYHNNANQGLKN